MTPEWRRLMKEHHRLLAMKRRCILDGTGIETRITRQAMARYDRKIQLVEAQLDAECQTEPRIEAGYNVVGEPQPPMVVIETEPDDYIPY